VERDGADREERSPRALKRDEQSAVCNRDGEKRDDRNPHRHETSRGENDRGDERCR